MAIFIDGTKSQLILPALARAWKLRDFLALVPIDCAAYISYETKIDTSMEAYKRNQVLEAIAITLGEGPSPSEVVKTAVKRLLDIDRHFKRSPRSNDPEQANYAFFSSDAPGSGVEVLFSPYEAFALLLGVDLLNHRWTQGTAVKILRQARPLLEPKHAEILSWNPEELFNWEKVAERARPGDLAVATTRPVSLAICSRLGRPVDHASDETREVAVLENGELMPFIRREAGISSTVIELTRLAHRLQSALAETTPSKRGRGSA
ncbi:hypothetical protein AUC71_01475 [Methyloceanibacter marginalis]|uniref:Uncharacterized protein n=1 Tax=Methyloceanibacter marginalis TaxID=1774971 RepID=A0A1E3WAS1_9HYPH|nr:hypothetical protein AUC71_01475 [Methyloceanibacter marginalis]